MAVFTVTTTADGGVGSLRQAVLDANALAGADVIEFDADVFDGEAEDLIRLTSGQISITDALTIVGGPAGVTITGDALGDDVTLAGGITDVAASLAGEDRLDDNSRIFAATAALTLDGLTLTGGRTTGTSERGGAVRGTTVTLIDSTVSGNSTAGYRSYGGGVAGYQAVTLTNSTLSGNGTAGDRALGGGVFSNSAVTLTSSTVSGNSTAGDDARAGGVFGDTVTLTNSTLSGNSTAGDRSYGGGVVATGRATLTNSTVSGNSAEGAGARTTGGVYARFGLDLNNSIVLGNATTLAGVGNDEIFVFSGFALNGGNILGGDIFDGDTDVGDVTAAQVFAATVEIAPGVFAGVLADNGGPTRTILIDRFGPAVDAGGATALATDQRGEGRVFGAAVDLGAVEIQEAGSLVVTTAADVVDDTDGLTSLREAVAFANAQAGADIITFDAGVFDGEAEDLIRLTLGEITITDELTIDGGAAGVTITGDADGDDVVDADGITDVAASLDGEDRLDDNSRIFLATAALTLDGLTLTGGRTTGAGAGESGGAVQGGVVTLIDSTVSGNSTAGDLARGGGVWGYNAVTLTNSSVSGNSTAGYLGAGGGVFGFAVTLTNSTVSGNSTTADRAIGGGVTGFSVTLTNSTVGGNSTAGDFADGGGVFGYSVTLTNSTVSGNSTAGGGSEGGGVFGSSVALTNSIVLGNATTYAGLGGDETSGSVTLAGGNIVGGDIFDGADDVGDVAAAEVFAATVEIAPGVLAGVLADNGGPTRTILIDRFGPAVDAGGATALLTDQRGEDRVFGAAVDLGAVEIQEAGSLVVTTAADVVDDTDGLTSLREAVAFANAQAGADTITFDAGVFDGGAEDLIRLTQGQITITDALTIDGGAAGVTITGDKDGDDAVDADGITDVAASLDGEDRLDDNSRIFAATAALTLDGLTLTGGRTTATGQDGGAVLGTTVTLTNSTVSGNSTAGFVADGGGVFGSAVTLTNSTVSGNATSGDRAYGGGVFGSTVTLTNSTVSGNGTTGNFADGGGVFGSTATLTNSTVSGNSTAGAGSDGGGVAGFDVALTNSIVLGNVATYAAVGPDDTFGPLSLTGGNIVGGDIFDGATDVGNVTAAQVFAATVEVAPGVFAGVLADNGGPTRTIAIRADGPAAGAADPASATAFDQRGEARDDAPDLGAFEAAGVGVIRVGGPGPDELTGTAFADDLRGRRGNDLLDGLGGDDLLRGDRGADELRGGAGDDTIHGGRGQDAIFGGRGDDVLTGGRGADNFVFEADFGDDVIADFDADPAGGQDRIDLRPLGITAASFAAEVAIAADPDGALVTVLGEGSILLAGVDPAAVGAADFLLS